MGVGISLMASQISWSVAATPCFCDCRCSFCAGVRGNSGTLKMDQAIVDTEIKPPIMKDTNVTCGMWLSPTASLFMPNQTNNDGIR